MRIWYIVRMKFLLKNWKDILWAGAAPIFVFLVNVVMSKGFDLYERVPATDIPMHFLGGVAIAYMLLRLKRIFVLPKNPYLYNLLVIVAVTATFAVVWEFGEFSMDYFLGTNTQKSLPDTMLDLALGMLGGLSVGLVFKREL